MSSTSALLGEHPLSADDALVSRALHIIVPSQLNPNKSLPYGPPRPPNYVYEERSTALVIGEAWAIFFVLLFTSARLYVRGMRIRSWGLDDWVIIPGALGCVVYLCLDIASETLGCMGKHIWDCTYESVAWLVLIGEVQEPIFYFTVFSIKLSIALANRRLTNTVSGRWRLIHYLFIALFLILLPITTFLNAFQCSPVRGNYSLWYIGTLTDPRQFTCLNRYAISLSTRVLHMLTDIALFCVPIVIVSRLQLTKAKRIRLIAVFAVGGISVISSIVRNALIFQDLEDMTWQSYTIYCFDVVDISFAAIVASLPALNAILESAMKRTKTFFGQDSSTRHLFSRVRGYASSPWRSRSAKLTRGSGGSASLPHSSEDEFKGLSPGKDIRVYHGYSVAREERQGAPQIVGMTDASAQFVRKSGTDGSR